ncbi:MAG TPA: hypothetical protein VFV38_16320 [Ktedonobacteraceae bacterium]|nr:hypothetical protein [Ktedonobacteraceae bacterium]
MAFQQQPQHSANPQHPRPAPQQRTASREEFLWRRKLDLEEQAFDIIARINALQDKLALIEDQKKTLKQELLDLQAKFQPNPLATFLTRRPQPDLRLLESQVRRLVEEEGKAKADLSLAQHSLDSLNAKVANLEFELSLL